MAKYEVIEPVTGTVYGERDKVGDARKLAKQYEGAVVRQKQHAAIKSISFAKAEA